MIVALLEYTNKNGKVAVKGFNSWEALSEFVNKLQKRGIPHLITRV